MKKLPLKNLVATDGISNSMERNPRFENLVRQSIIRFVNLDFGDVEEKADRELNALALDEVNPQRILAVYTIPNSIGKEWMGVTDRDGVCGLDKFWIITEWDRSITTVLFPSEY